MPDTTPVLSLPYILPSQAQKHVTHNEAIRLLDVIVQLSVASRILPVPPPSPVHGERFIVAAGAVGTWAGQAGKIALYENGAWQFFTPIAGWTAWVTSEQVLASYTGSGWVSQADGPFNVGQLGVSATPDNVNRLSVSAPATLLNHAGAGHQLKVNKAAAGDTASLLFQTGFSGRAEMGTAGSDDFAIKVSADGSAFVTGLSIAAATGQVTLPAAARLGGQAADPALPADGTIWLNTTTGEVKLRSAGATIVLASGALGVADGDKGDITVSAGGTVWTIDAGAVGNAKLAAMPTATFKARLSAGTGAPEDILPADAASLLPAFSTSAKGLAPASGGGTANFLRADGTWAAPTGGGGSLAGLGITATAEEINRAADVPAPPSGHFLVGDPAWNLAKGAAEPTNGQFWESGVTTGGVTATRGASGTDAATGEPWVEYALAGTMTGTTATFGYISVAGSQTAGLTGETWTASVRFSVISGSIGSGARALLFDGSSRAGNTVTTLAATLSTVTRTLASDVNVRCALQIVGTTGTVISATVRVQGLQFERSAARSIGRQAYASASTARGLLGLTAGDTARTALGFGTSVLRNLAFVSFNGTTGAILQSSGVSSVTRLAAGNYTVNFSATMPHANYAVVASNDAASSNNRVAALTSLRSTASCDITIERADLGHGGGRSDSTFVTAIFVW